MPKVDGAVSDHIEHLEAEVERLRAALETIRDTWVDIPAEDMVANLKATAAVALDGDAAAEKLACAAEQEGRTK